MKENKFEKKIKDNLVETNMALVPSDTILVELFGFNATKNDDCLFDKLI